jgi:hypothetical protein
MTNRGPFSQFHQPGRGPRHATADPPRVSGPVPHLRLAGPPRPETPANPVRTDDFKEMVDDILGT